MSIDSATSESFQSSTGGADFEDFDSRPPPDPISSYLGPSPPPFPQTSRAIFDPFSNFLSDLSAAAWPPPPPPPPPPLPPPPNSAPVPASSSPRASKKRARASRRAPTTVLTTDTSNFRAMVQEFTGIPAPPFASTSVFSRPRLDLFNHSAASASAPSFLLRPYAHKRHGIGVPASLSGISPNTLPSPATLPNQTLFSSPAQNPSLGLQSLLHEHHRGTILAPCQWPAGGGYSGGELGSVIAGAAAAEADSSRIRSCNTDRTESSHSENMKPAAEGFSPARGEGGVDASWQLSSD